VDRDYGLVMGALVYEAVLNFYLIVNVVDARKKYNVKYPNLYADRNVEGEKEANEFNCI